MFWKQSVEIVTQWRTELQRRTSEPALATFYVAFRASTDRPIPFLLKNPANTALAVGAICRLSLVVAPLSGGVEGQAIRRTLLRRVGGLSAGRTGIAVLSIPEDSDDYLQGRAKQTLRRKIRAAERAGLKCVLVDDLSERHDLFVMANQFEPLHQDELYRNERPDNRDLLQCSTWMKVVDPQGRAIMLAVIPVDGEWSSLRYFRTLGHGPMQSDARYLMSNHLVAELSGRGVRYLVDTWHPGEIPEGLRHFQRMLGFRMKRVAVARSAS